MWLGLLAALSSLRGLVCVAQGQHLRGPPLVDGRPNLLDSFLPAGMQVIAHLTDLMKYDLRPQSPAMTTTTTTTARPTPAHRPGLYAPAIPPGPEAYFAAGSSYEDYVQRLLLHDGHGYFDRYQFPVEEVSARGHGPGSVDGVSDEVDLLVGRQVADLVRLVNRIDDDVRARSDDPDDYPAAFAKDYRAVDPALLLRQKKVPPTKAYVTLLSLYDLLNKESKKLGLNKYQGYSLEVLRVLVDTSGGTSADQLRVILDNISERRDTKDANILARINAVLKDLAKDDSYLNDALRYIPPLQFSG